ncbi:uncharacterized protein SETTUDRAFT_112173, partial [Exserohilum turcica Et28A]
TLKNIYYNRYKREKSYANIASDLSIYSYNVVTGRVLLDCARNYNAPTAPKRLAQDIRAADIVA